MTVKELITALLEEDMDLGVYVEAKDAAFFVSVEVDGISATTMNGRRVVLVPDTELSINAHGDK